MATRAKGVFDKAGQMFDGPLGGIGLSAVASAHDEIGVAAAAWEQRSRAPHSGTEARQQAGEDIEGCRSARCGLIHVA